MPDNHCALGPIAYTSAFKILESTGLDGLRSYLREKRQDDFVDNVCKKLFSYALGRGLLLSDKKALDGMRTKLMADDYAFGSLVEAIVTSPQFLNTRGPAAR